MTGFDFIHCPNQAECSHSYQRSTIQLQFYAPVSQLPYYRNPRDNALTIRSFLPRETREVGWVAAEPLPYKYENNCLSVEQSLYYWNTKATRAEILKQGWYPPEKIPWKMDKGYLEVTGYLPNAGWVMASLLPYSKTVDGLFVESVYNYECQQLGWESAIELIHIYQMVVCDNYCPSCGSYKVASVVFDDSKENYTSHHHCPECLWTGSIIPHWIEQNYFLESFAITETVEAHKTVKSLSDSEINF